MNWPTAKDVARKAREEQLQQEAQDTALSLGLENLRIVLAFLALGVTIVVVLSR